MPKLPRNEWEALITLALDGDEDSCTQLVSAYSPMIRATAAKYCQPEDVDDVTQITWMQIFRYLKGFEGRSEFGTWCYRIATTQALMWKRSQSRRHEVGMEAAWDVASPENPFEYAGDRDKVHALIAANRHAYMDTVRLRLDGYNIPEIAEMSGWVKGTVKSNYHRGVNELRNRMLGRSE